MLDKFLILCHISSLKILALERRIIEENSNIKLFVYNI